MIAAAARRHLFLAGFMGTGKSAVGRALAGQLGRPFVDLDAMVESLHSRSIVAIFRGEGEAAFRLHEAKALRLVLGSPPSVIALGGGAPTVPAIANMVRQTGHTVLLTAVWEVIWRRVHDDCASRPLLAPVLDALCGDASLDDACQLARFIGYVDPILKSRKAAYERIADLTINTSELTVTQVVDRIVPWYRGEA
jgi:shikimate kinase